MKRPSRKLAIIHNFFSWTLAGSRARVDLAPGRVPPITWTAATGSTGISVDDIINGVHDALITTHAQAAKAVGGKFSPHWGTR
jgi:hypothetical protein